MNLLKIPARAPRETPVVVLVRGAAAGLLASMLLSLLSRVLPGMRVRPQPRRAGIPNPRDRAAIQAWQARGQSPAAHRDVGGRHDERAPRGITPAGALSQPQAPGPEGLAEQFAFKVAQGVFGRDIAPRARLAGMAVHLAYGSAWGSLYGVVQASVRWPPGLLGAGYGLLVWAVGPALLVPAMRLMRAPTEEPPLRTAMLVTGHVAYGLALAAAFEAMEREAS